MSKIINCPKCQKGLRKITVSIYEYVQSYKQKLKERIHIGFYCIRCIKFFPVGNVEVGKESDLMNLKEERKKEVLIL